MFNNVTSHRTGAAPTLHGHARIVIVPTVSRTLGAALLATALLVTAACKRQPAPAAGDDARPAGRDATTATAIDCRHVAGDDALAAIDRALTCGAAALARYQDARGAIAAPTYAAFRDGHATTALAALALGQAPGTTAASAYRRAIDFVATAVGADGRFVTPAPPYPLYVAAIGALALSTPGNERHRAARDALLGELRRLQLGAANGWRPADVSYGGWGYAERPPVRPTAAGYDPDRDDERAANLSATLLAIGALRLAGATDDDPALVAARTFVDRCQNRVAACAGEPCPGDGGFVFTPAPALRDSNKAGAIEGGPPRSYGTMTADGVRALLRLGVPPADPRVREAAGWLTARFDPASPPGDFPPAAESRRAAGAYYWAWSAAHALHHLGVRDVASAHGPIAWAPALTWSLLDRQAADGTWRNPATELREDDPVVATSFAMAALAVTRQVIAGDYRSHAGWK